MRRFASKTLQNDEHILTKIIKNNLHIMRVQGDLVLSGITNETLVTYQRKRHKKGLCGFLE
jgi:hypothetical protein